MEQLNVFEDKDFTEQASGACRDALTLCNAPRGSLLRITRLGSCPRDNCRLCALGLTPGTQVEILSCGVGLTRILVRGCNLVLDAGLAGLVACELVEGARFAH